MQLPSLERLSLRPQPACPTDANGEASDDVEDRLINYNRVRIVPIPPSMGGAYSAVQALFKNTNPKALNLRKVRAKMTDYNQLKIVGMFELVYNQDHPVYDAYTELRDQMQVTTQCNNYDSFYERVRTDGLENMSDESGLGPLRPWLNEKYLLHGTPVSSLDAVLRSAIDPTRTTASVYSPQNNVFYQAEDVGKADQYASPEGNLYRRLNEELGIDTSREMIPRTYYMLISRTLLGCANHIAQETNQRPGPYYKDLKSMDAYQSDGKFRKGYDSLIVEHNSRARGSDYQSLGNFREFLVQKSAQVLPVMLVAYVRVMARPEPPYDRMVLDIVKGTREHPWWLVIPKLLKTLENDKAFRRRAEAFDGLTKAVPLFCQMMKDAMETDGPDAGVFKSAVPVLLLLMRTCYGQPWENDVIPALLKIMDDEVNNHAADPPKVLRWLSGQKDVNAIVSAVKDDVDKEDGLGALSLLHHLLLPVEHNYWALRHAVEADVVPTLIDMAKHGLWMANALPEELHWFSQVENEDDLEIYQRSKLYLAISTLGDLTSWTGSYQGAIKEQLRDERGGGLPGGMIRILLNTLDLIIGSTNRKELVFKKVLVVLDFAIPDKQMGGQPAISMAMHYNALAILESVLFTLVRENLSLVGLTCKILSKVLSASREGSWGTRNPEAERFLKLENVKEIFETANVRKSYKEEDFRLLIWELQFTLEIYLTTGTEAEKLLALTILSAGPAVKYLYKGDALIGHLAQLVLEDETDTIVGKAIDLLTMHYVFEVLLHYESYRNGTWTAIEKDTEKLVWYVTAYAKHMAKREDVKKAFDGHRYAYRRISRAWHEGNYNKKTSSAHGVSMEQTETFAQFLLYEQSVGNLFEADVREYWLATRDEDYGKHAATKIMGNEDGERYLVPKIKYPTERYMDAIKPEWEAWKARNPSENSSPLHLYARIEWTDLSDEERKPYIDAYQKAVETYELFGSDSETDERSPPRKTAKKDRGPPVNFFRRVVIDSSSDEADGE